MRKAVVGGICVLGLALVLLAADTKAEFTIDDYVFTWTVIKAGNVQLDVRKTQDNTLIRLASDGLDVILPMPVDAEAIGGILEKTDEYYDRLHGQTNAQSEEARAGKYVVEFRTTDKCEFYVSIRSAADFSMERITLERKEARDLAPTMLKAKRLAAFVDERVRP